MFPLRSNDLPEVPVTRATTSFGLNDMARPKLNDIDKRIIQVNIRLTEAENAKVIVCAQESGMTPANWIRTVVFSGKFPPPKLSALDASVYRELKKIGINLNQITHKINQGDMSGDYLERQFELAEMLKRILALLNP